MKIELIRIKHRFISKLIAWIPQLSKVFIDLYTPLDTTGIPWTQLKKSLKDSKVAVVTTAGIHHTNQEPFDMKNPDGDSSFRVIDITRPLSSLMITHDYYDHTDADRDINIIFPVSRLKEFCNEGIIKAIANINYSFMGHINGALTNELINNTSPEVARRIKKESVDAVLLTPG